MKNKNNLRALLAAVLGAVIVFLMGQCPADGGAVDPTAVAALEDSLSTFRNERAEWGVQTATMESTIADLLRAAHHGDSLADELGRKAEQYRRKLRDVTAMSTKGHIEAPFLFATSDTIRDTVQIYTDPWNSIALVPSGVPDAEATEPPAPPNIVVDIKDRITVSHVWGRKPGFLHLWGRRPLTVQVENANPLVSIVGLRSWSIKHDYVPGWKFWKKR